MFTACKEWPTQQFEDYSLNKEATIGYSSQFRLLECINSTGIFGTFLLRDFQLKFGGSVSVEQEVSCSYEEKVLLEEPTHVILFAVNECCEKCQAMPGCV